MNELFINGKRADLSDLTNVGVTFCANNIGELQNRQGNFTNTFKIPLTKTNKEILEWSHLQTSSSLIPYKKNKATYIQNGIEIISDGVAEIQSTDNDYFYINVYSGNLDLIEAIGGLTVGELYASDGVYNWALSNCFYTASDYFVYPLIDWRADIDTFFTTSTIDVREMLPTAIVHKMFTRLSNKIGYTFTGNYLNSSDHLNMVLTPNELKGIDTGVEVLNNRNNYISDKILANISIGTATEQHTLYPTFSFSYNEKTLATDLPDFALGIFKPTINKIGTLKFTGNYRLWWSKTENFGAFTSASDKEVTAYAVCSFIDDLGTIIESRTSTPSTKTLDVFRAEFDFDFDFETTEQTFYSSRQYKIKVDIFTTQNNKVNSKIEFFNQFTDSFGSRVYQYIRFTQTQKIAFGNPLSFPSLFTMKVVDVLKDILNMEAIIIQTNNYTKTIQFNKFEDVVLNKPIAKKWSDKIQFNKSMGFTFGNYARRNNLKFKTDSYENGIIWLSDETLEAEKDMIKLNHDPTFQYQRFNAYKIPTIDGLKDINNEWLSPTYRLLQLKIQSTTFNVNYTDGTTTTPKTTVIPFCEFYNFDRLIGDNYNAITNILKSPKVLKIIANLDVTDISDLDFSIPIDIQRPDLNLSGYFYINKIENYKGGLTSCEIIEI